MTKLFFGRMTYRKIIMWMVFLGKQALEKHIQIYTS